MTRNPKYTIAIDNFNFVLVYVIVLVFYIWHDGILHGHWITTAGIILLILTYFGIGRVAEIMRPKTES
jgi:hypothetical protein